MSSILRKVTISINNDILKLETIEYSIINQNERSYTTKKIGVTGGNTIITKSLIDNPTKVSFDVVTSVKEGEGMYKMSCSVYTEQSEQIAKDMLLESIKRYMEIVRTTFDKIETTIK